MTLADQLRLYEQEINVPKQVFRALVAAAALFDVGPRVLCGACNGSRKGLHKWDQCPTCGDIEWPAHHEPKDNGLLRCPVCGMRHSPTAM